MLPLFSNVVVAAAVAIAILVLVEDQNTESLLLTLTLNNKKRKQRQCGLVQLQCHYNSQSVYLRVSIFPFFFLASRLRNRKTSRVLSIGLISTTTLFILILHERAPSKAFRAEAALS